MKEGHVTFQNRSTKLLILYSVLSVLVLLFLGSVWRTIHSDRYLPYQHATRQDRAVRGTIISADGYTLSLPRKQYKAVVYAPGIDPEKQKLFVHLFSIYSHIPEAKIEAAFFDKEGEPKRGYVTIGHALDAGSAIHLRVLAHTLRRMHVFRPIVNRHGVKVVYGLDIIESGEQRIFPLHDVCEPALGYVQTHEKGKYRDVQGTKGLEQHYESFLSARQDGRISGERDVAGFILRNGQSTRQQRIDGMNIHLNIPLALQRRVESVLDHMAKETEAHEVIGAIMESRTGALLALASSRRFDPAHIHKNDIENLNPKFTEYPYEPGSVIKPLTLAIALDLHKVTPRSWFNVLGGKLKISNKFTISDDEAFSSLTATDIIVHSSNVGISQIAWRLTGQAFHDGFLAFGLSQPSGIDLSRELRGQIKSAKLLQRKVHSANQAYGYGMTATFVQLLKAYSAFDNDGITVTPRIVQYLEEANGTRVYPENTASESRAISAQTAHQIHEILKEVVQRGTGTQAQYPGLEVGGKTGTAHISKGRTGYSEAYHSSFYGFVDDDKGHRYTLGVLVIKPSRPQRYFASKSAVPTFKKMVDILVDQHYLQPNLSVIEQKKRLQKAKELRAIQAQKQRERTRKFKARLKTQREGILHPSRPSKRVAPHAKPMHPPSDPMSPPAKEEPLDLF